MNEAFRSFWKKSFMELKIVKAEENQHSQHRDTEKPCLVHENTITIPPTMAAFMIYFYWTQKP